MSASEDHDLYEILNVSVRAEPEVVTAAYRALAQKYHPDKHRDEPRAEQRMALLNLAYETLRDPEKRAHYDGRRSAPRARDGAVPPPPQYQGRWRPAKIVDDRAREQDATILAIDPHGVRVRCKGAYTPLQDLRIVLPLGMGKPPLGLKLRFVRSQGEEYEFRFWSLSEPIRERLDWFIQNRV